MAEQLTVTTLYARQQMAKARAEGGTLTKIVKMAFGNGGTNDTGEPISLQGTEQALKNELLQKDIDGFVFMEPAKVRYTCTLEESELAGEIINELALVDENGKFTAVRTMTDKHKDGDIEFVFEIDDIY
ncbi:phage tail protein [Bacillus swezeyi]|uniref:Phage tail fibre protein N-terminal domain-containing protein n=1 Tax=Bacillus swezeyi TaxID=1925020 RepID=A0A1R1RQ84_9BACI|nr:phage tail protein [Bacillus swezeyi]MEC1262495.1 phage tail protein [Bacillus swezeyi]MED1739097.1 phage tail protein [Bacillus swezeyi]MED2926796.1 phage tail protein [Bacillus swezeyi]MED2943426.1 phage tail protein [Bacillus swezeyi]MED2965642.1 phage tail protein [Bacillus swezeyi]